MTGHEIVELVGTVCGSTAGAAVISFGAFLIKDAIVNKIQAKKAKLSEREKDEIAERVFRKFKEGVEVDMSGKLNKETNNLVNDQKKTLNAVVKNQNEQYGLIKVIAKALTSFNAVRVSSSLQELNTALENADPSKIEQVEVEEEYKVKYIPNEEEEPKVEDSKVVRKY